MIEKLKNIPVDMNGKPSAVWLKINELVDTINKLETMAKNTNTVLKSLVEENNIHEKQIDELQMKVDVLFSRFDMISLALEKKNARPHKEQQDWLGHIVEYGNADDGFKYGILTNIDDTFSAFPYEIDNGRDATADCWLPDESLFYKREEK